jgi:hypothetical protein
MSGKLEPAVATWELFVFAKPVDKGRAPNKFMPKGLLLTMDLTPPQLSTSLYSYRHARMFDLQDVLLIRIELPHRMFPVSRHS